MDTLSKFCNELTHRKEKAMFDILLTLVGLMILIARLKSLEDQLLNVLVWVVVIFSSLITSLNYILLLLETRSTIKHNIIIWKSLTIGLLGIISSLMLLDTIWQAINIALAQFKFYSIIILFLTAILRLMHCYLGGKANLMPE